jgi:ABC-2 type transport system ATP-binding protein
MRTEMTETVTSDVISITDVTKVFRLGVRKKKTAVEGLTLSIPKGRIVGLLGPNGSGKSTTLKMLMGFLKPTQGQILICGVSSEERRARSFLGYLPENPKFQRFLTGREALFYYGKLLSLPTALLTKRIDELLELVGLRHAGDERVHGYSKGMTQRLAIAQSLLNSPSILIFDEPMSGLDPLGRFEIRQLIQRVHTEMPEATILFSTHILADVELLCSDVALLRKGKLSSYCAIEDLLVNNEERFDLIVRDPGPELRERLRKAHATETRPIGLIVTIDGTESFMRELEEIRRQGVKVVGVTSHRRTLEEALFADTPLTAPRQPEEVSR